MNSNLLHLYCICHTMKKFLIIFLLILPFVSQSQVVDDFSDGNFETNPVWTGTTADFIVNSAQQIQTNATIATISYLTTPNGLTDLNDIEWSFYLKHSFSGSSSNYTRIYLTADSSNLNIAKNGYYLQFGEAGSNDAIRLVRTENGTDMELLSGASGNIASSFGVRVKVIHTATGTWELYTDYSGGINYTLEATAIDGNTVAATYFGIGCVYTVSNIKKIYFDDLYIGNIVTDESAPEIAAVQVLDAKNVQIVFSENIAPSLLDQTLSFQPNLAVNQLSFDDPATLHINFSEEMMNGQTYIASIPSVKDMNDNDTSITFTFTYMVAEEPEVGDVIITEFLSDPTPSVGLPEQEYIEIYNKSTKIFNVLNWKIKNDNSTGTIQSAWLLPGRYLVIASTTNATLFTPSVGATSFPSYKNAGDEIILTDESGQVLDQLRYSLDWFQGSTKKDGGYSLERVHLNISCSDAMNWKPSVDLLGGTPGYVNSVNDISPDTLPPTIQFIQFVSDTVLQVAFSEPLSADWNLISTTIQPNISFSIPSLTKDSTSLSIFYLHFSTALEGSREYSISFANVMDCQGNSANELSYIFTVPSVPGKGEIVFNELLFNPNTGGSDFIELKNVSEKTFNLKNLQFTNTKTGSSNTVSVSADYFLYPQEIVVLTPDSAFQKENYPFHGVGNYLQMGIPALSVSGETIVLRLDSVVVIDSLTFTDKWHFQLLSDFKGRSLERINDNALSTEQGTWHTASESVGFATPGVENSQNTVFLYNGKMSLGSDTFSPDNDGFEDVLTIAYEMEGIGYVGTLTVYDDRGRLIRKLVENELLGNRGSFTWDGMNDEQQRAHIGTYILVFEGYQVSSGKTFKMKKVAVLAGDL